MEHTPVPWKVVDRWKIVRDAGHPLPRLIVETTISGECEVYQGNADEANAAFIVQAVNSHEALVEALDCDLLELAAETLGREVGLPANGIVMALRGKVAKERAALKLAGVK